MTLDTPAPGVVIAQPARGYRYAADAFLLAGLAVQTGPVGRSLDLGTGCGVIPLLLARLGYTAGGVEAQAAWSRYWRTSLEQSAVAASLRVGRVQELPAESVDVVTANPPYVPAGRGPTSPDPLKAAAHTELDGTLADFVAAAARSVTDVGRVVFIVPRIRAEELQDLYRREGLFPVERLDVGPRRTLVRAARTPGPYRNEAIPARGSAVDALYGAARA
jgi:tRNA1Val (adenine37-N6)-methyltransferase